MFIFLKRNPNLILAFDLRIFYFVSKSDCNICLIVFQTTVKLCSKISNFTSTVKKYDRRWQKLLYSSYKIRSDFFYLWRHILEVFSSLLKAEEDYKTYKQKQSEVNELPTTYAGVLRHAQQQDKLNAKRLIHGICSIFRLFRYQINTKFVLTVSRRIHFLSSIH